MKATNLKYAASVLAAEVEYMGLNSTTEEHLNTQLRNIMEPSEISGLIKKIWNSHDTEHSILEYLRAWEQHRNEWEII